MEILSSYTFLIAVMWVYMTGAFLLALLLKRNDIADVAWGPGFLVVALASAYQQGEFTPLGAIADFLVALWAVRLALHIGLRNRGKGEDYRYKAWRDSWGKWFYLRSYLQVFMLQGALLLVVSAPVVVANVYTGPLSILTDFGITVWAIGFLFEAIGDLQLKRFVANPANRGKLMQSGLWAYTRHPNYFGEVTQWWGMWFLVMGVPAGIFAMVGPATITYLILKVSGIPMLEQKMASNPEFAAYAKRVSAFVPLPPRRV